MISECFVTQSCKEQSLIYKILVREECLYSDIKKEQQTVGHFCCAQDIKSILSIMANSQVVSMVPLE